MPNRPVPFDLRQDILKIHHCDPARSARQIALDVGLHHKTVSRILKGEVPYIPETQLPPEDKQEVGPPILKESSEIKGDSWVITLPKTRIHTEKELIEYFQVDTGIWEIERLICNVWEMGYIARSTKVTSADGKTEDVEREAEALPLYQTKAYLKKKKEVEAARNEIEELKKLAAGWGPVAPFIIRECSLSRLMLEMNMPDVHFGKLAWGVETGHSNYDVKIAESVYWTAFESVLTRVKHHTFAQILFVVGNDLLNSDDIEGRTTAGTYVSSDARYHKTFSAVRNTMVRAVERLRQIAPVKVVIVGGNHDQLSCWHLGDSLECFFHNYEDVEIDNLPRARKYHRHGSVMLMLTHGHKGKRNDYPLLMATEQSQMFGETKFRECHTGHIHMTKLDEQHGVRVRILPALTAVDDWLATNGFVGNLRNAEGYVWSADEGLIEQVYYTVPE